MSDMKLDLSIRLFRLGEAVKTLFMFWKLLSQFVLYPTVRLPCTLGQKDSCDPGDADKGLVHSAICPWICLPCPTLLARVEGITPSQIWVGMSAYWWRHRFAGQKSFIGAISISNRRAWRSLEQRSLHRASFDYDHHWYKYCLRQPRNGESLWAVWCLQLVLLPVAIFTFNDWFCLWKSDSGLMVQRSTCKFNGAFLFLSNRSFMFIRLYTIRMGCIYKNTPPCLVLHFHIQTVIYLQNLLPSMWYM